jgi:D-3-phosphoglycerate dehydrogenase / 2-oxoglutarate reductase
VQTSTFRRVLNGAGIINFARGELVDSEALKALYDSGEFFGNYISDFPVKELNGNPHCQFLPHLGASTEEAEEAAAAMAAEEIRDFLEHGIVRNSVNFPETNLKRLEHHKFRIGVVNNNVPGVLGALTTVLGNLGTARAFCKCVYTRCVFDINDCAMFSVRPEHHSDSQRFPRRVSLQRR